MPKSSIDSSHKFLNFKAMTAKEYCKNFNIVSVNIGGAEVLPISVVHRIMTEFARILCTEQRVLCANAKRQVFENENGTFTPVGEFKLKEVDKLAVLNAPLPEM